MNPIAEGDVQEESSDLRHDAAHVVKTFATFVKAVSVSETLPQSPSLLYINLTSLEGSSYCIELSTRGYRIVGQAYNFISSEDESVFESISALLESVSPLYTMAFGDALIRKLEIVQQKLQESGHTDP
ncbi:hypothetical protein RvY_15859-2 [Ramazzottius varieornatus]|uniref:GSKIP domain-containing protein n=1 Tax=Ramazzottius varieornatus TaxID=947166 RepID=A0A1D1VWE3_RAMVA|nr:hypothetical protein RvY_15859-2 [Ramazzottius varieornatus]